MTREECFPQKLSVMLKSTRRYLALVRIALLVAGPAFSAVAGSDVAVDWDKYYHYANRSERGEWASRTSRDLALKYRNKLIVDVLGRKSDQLPVRIASDQYSFAVLITNQRALQNAAHWKVQAYLAQAGFDMELRYFELRGQKVHHRYVYEWRQGNCLLRFIEIPRVQSTLTFSEVSERLKTDFPHLERPWTELN